MGKKVSHRYYRYNRRENTKMTGTGKTYEPKYKKY